ncbi:MAG TPA: hypothetical protein VL966_13900 [Alphaproteobacteria bacterium]|jgi:hypothetical protein|nr:hypothetical protein [Alphaproteobacteria bacterium]
MTRWLGLAVAVATVGSMLVATGCSPRPGYNAYGRYQNQNSNSSQAVYDRLKSTDKDDWFKDRPM